MFVKERERDGKKAGGVFAMSHSNAVACIVSLLMVPMCAVHFYE